MAGDLVADGGDALPANGFEGSDHQVAKARGVLGAVGLDGGGELGRAQAPAAAATFGRPRSCPR